MSRTAITRYDVAVHLRTPEEMAAYLDACLQEAPADAALIPALGDIARAKGMTQVARDAGLSRESLYKALSDPDFDTILRVIGALGLQLRAEAARQACRSAPPPGEYRATQPVASGGAVRPSTAERRRSLTGVSPADQMSSSVHCQRRRRRMVRRRASPRNGDLSFCSTGSGAIPQ